ncbi:zinc finger BED domain-containing protein 4-like [Gadus macrocephalus]|uniref:zinc finger BED domain-containing protein 4-like n=1 Tax=Gadus macrocephalus TaxID=80720 RepID=UPI0028CB1CF3|nr:zinc finger BED domain-containing protein 4-like [Gadus macrocephalus]
MFPPAGTFYMTASLLEQKSAISLYAADHQLPATLTASDWTLLEKINTLLAPFEEITKQISFATSTTSEVIPSVIALKRLLAKQTTEGSGIKTMKATLLAAMGTRFQTVEAEPLYCFNHIGPTLQRQILHKCREQQACKKCTDPRGGEK